MSVLAAAVPTGVIGACEVEALYEVGNALTGEVEDGEGHVSGLGQFKGDDGLGVEGIRVIAAQGAICGLGLLSFLKDRRAAGWSPGDEAEFIYVERTAECAPEDNVFDVEIAAEAKV